MVRRTSAAMHRRDIQNRSPALFVHIAGSTLGAKEIAADIDLELFVEERLVRIEEIDRTRHSGIVDQPIETAQKVICLLDDSEAGFDLTKISADGNRAGAQLYALGHGLFGSGATTGIVNCNVVSSTGELDRYTLPDTETSPGNECSPAVLTTGCQGELLRPRRSALLLSLRGSTIGAYYRQRTSRYGGRIRDQ